MALNHARLPIPPPGLYADANLDIFLLITQNIFEKIYSFEFSKTRIKNQALRKYITMKLINKILYFCNKNN